MNNRASKVNKGNLTFDKKGLIFEAYNIKGIDTKSCKTIFFDWAIDLEMETDQKHAISQLLDEYSPILQDVTTDDVKEKVKEKRLPRLKKLN